MSRYQKGFGVVEVIIVIVVLCLVGVGIWYVWQANNGKNSTSNTNNTNNDQPAASTNKPLEIPQLGIKINDPDGRNLQVHAQKVCGAECDTEDSYFIRDENDDYFSRCEYSAGIDTISESEAQSLTNKKKIDNTYYYVFAGTNYQSPCMNLEPGDEEYEDEFRQYIVDNMVKL